MFVKLVPGHAVRDPATMRLLVEDKVHYVEDNQFWHRRLRDGDVVVIHAPVDGETVEPS